ncbi:glycoside hydrolase family 16 protein [Armillaria novae-zelandiae]|uniref:Glycoside hydrolase family 16 protein n=1 Tax=Armillaria novae-zelandiae TaxID=153914 RepID=A0AA39UBK2_9AGAR|nr:glycoside hydrolase family 16 protein [Armillaria novae-zelandiae]
MLLYDFLPPPRLRHSALDVPSNRSSTISLDLDSKYPITAYTRDHGLIPYAYEPTDDFDDDETEEKATKTFPWRGIANIAALFLLIVGVLLLFIFYPVEHYYSTRSHNEAVISNVQVNGSGQAPVLFQMPSLIDPDTPSDVRKRTGYDGEDYTLVFSDEFNRDGRTFHPGDDPYWEAVDLWYGATADQEWYDPRQVTTRDGSLVITMDSISTLVAAQTPSDYRSGMLQSWNKFCFTTGYIEVAVVLPGPDENTQGYWPGIWTMGNLARPGYPATTDGMWPYTYDSCDIGTFPNQTLKDGSGPAAALHSDASRSKYNYELSWLSGQRLSACTCPSSDHPGPLLSSGAYRGRGAPEIDIFEAEKDKLATTGQVVSQSAQFAPFTADYVYGNATDAEWKIYDESLTRANSYRGSAVQQAVSALTHVPSGNFQGGGKEFVVYGFEYYSNPNSRSDGFITWITDGKPSVRMGASAMAADPTGSGVSDRLVPEEPMSITLNLGISSNWQDIDTSTMIFPTEMLVDYVRVYQRSQGMNVGCNPPGYPTKDYINNHIEAYTSKFTFLVLPCPLNFRLCTDPNLTTWQWDKPKNSEWDGC